MQCRTETSPKTNRRTVPAGESLLLRSHIQMLLYPYNHTYRQTFQANPLVSDILVLEVMLNPGITIRRASCSAVENVKVRGRLLIHSALRSVASTGGCHAAE